MAHEKMVSILQDAVQRFEATLELWADYIHVHLNPKQDS